MDSSQIGLAGEYYVLAQLAHRDLVGTLTLSNTKGIDILVTNQSIRRLYKVEVKTTTKAPSRALLFGPKPFISWRMSQKHEKIRDLNLFYIFVYLPKPSKRPRFFVVPSNVVAKYVRWQHQHWLKSRKKVKDTAMRNFRIRDADPENYEDNWSVFKK